MEKKQLTNEARALFAEWGRQSSGPEKMKKKGKAYFSRIGKMGAEARKLKAKQTVDNSVA